MTKRHLTFALMAMTMLLLVGSAMAAPGDAMLFTQQDGYHQVYISASTVVGDKAYMIEPYGYGYGTMHILTAGQTEPASCGIGDVPGEADNRYLELFADGERLMALDVSCGDVFEMAPVDGQFEFSLVAQLDWTNMVEDNGDWQERRESSAPLMMENTLYMAAYTIDYSSVELLAFSMADGSCRVVSKIPGYAVTAGREGELLYLRTEVDDWLAPLMLCSLSVKDGSSTEVCKLAENDALGMAYDAENDQVVYCSGGIVYATARDGKTTKLSSSSVTSGYGMGSYAACMPGGYYFLWNGGEGVMVRNIDPQYRPTRTLTIRCDYLEADNTYRAFIGEHPEASVKTLMNTGRLTSEEVTRDMMNGSSETDIYQVTVGSAVYRAMTKRGYVADLSGSAALSEMVGRMFPQIQEVLTKDGKLVAFPLKYSDSCLAINVKAAEKLGLGRDNLPKTWDDLLDLVERWDRDYAREFPEKTIFDPYMTANMKEALLKMIMDDYVTAINRPGAEEKFNTEALRHLLDRLDHMDFSAFESEKDFSNGYFWSNEDVLLVNDWEGIMPKEGGMWGRKFEVLELALGEGMEPVVKVNMEVYVVNPYSKNQDLAIAYLETLARELAPGRKAGLLADWNEPIENPNFERTVQYYEDAIALYQAVLADKDPAEVFSEETLRQMGKIDTEYMKGMGKQELEVQLASLEKYYELAKEERYYYDAEDLARYHEKAGRLVIMQNRYFDENGKANEEMRSVLSRYMGGQLSSAQMLENLDQKLRMMQMEDD